MTLIQDFDEVDLGMQDGTFEISREEEVAAASDVEHRTGKFRELYIHKVSHRIIFHETACLHLHSEGVHLREVFIILCPDHSYPSFHCVTFCTKNVTVVHKKVIRCINVIFVAEKMVYLSATMHQNRTFSLKTATVAEKL